MQTYNQKRGRFSNRDNPNKVARVIPAQMKKVVEDDDLLTEILVHIPPAIVVSLMCISKRWSKLISSYAFRLRHSSLSPEYFPATSVILQSSSPTNSQSHNRNPMLFHQPHIQHQMHQYQNDVHNHLDLYPEDLNNLYGYMPAAGAAPVNHYLPQTQSVPRQATVTGLQSRKGKLLYLLKNENFVFETKSYSDELDLFFSFIFESLPFALRANPNSVSFQILHAANGLLLVSFNAPGETRYYVCNPLTQDYLQLPLPYEGQSQPLPYGGRSQLPIPFGARRAESGFGQKRMRLVFNPLKSPHYKVVCISDTTLPEGAHICVQVYSSVNRTWGNPKEISSCPEFRGIFDSVVYNDVLCWTTSISGGTHKQKLHTFDLASLRIRSLPMPPGVRSSSFHLCESRSSLYLVERFRTGVEHHPMGMDFVIMNGHGGQQPPNFNYNIWEMKDTGVPSWVSKFDFQHEYLMEILHVHSSNKEQGLLIFLASGSLIYCLNSNNYTDDKELEHVGVLSSAQERQGYGYFGYNPHRSRHSWDIITYTNTLFPVDCRSCLF